MRIACVAPAVMVISLSALYLRPCSASILEATALRREGTPGMGGYWLWPARMAWYTASTSAGSQSKSGKPWPRFTAPTSAASADITVKMVVPTSGSLLCSAGVRTVGAVMVWGVGCQSS